MLPAFSILLFLLCLPVFALGQQDSAKSPKLAVNAGFLMGGGSGVGADVEYLFAKNRWGVQAGAGLVGFGAGVSYHLKPHISSPFVSLQYWRQVGAKESSDVLGAMYVYRYKRWLQAGAGLGTFLSENGEQKAGEALLMFQAGIFVPISPTNIKSKLSATLQVAENEEKEKEDAHSRPRQAVYCELLGRSSLLYAVNYDRRFFTGSGGAGASVGFGYIDLFGVTAFMLPVGVYYLAGSENHHVELGAGITTLGNSTSSGILLQPFGTATVGYRYQPARGFLFRIGFTPMYTTRGFAPWGGASFGAAF